MGDDINIRETRYRFLRISNFDRLPQSPSPSNFKVDISNDYHLNQATELYIHSISLPNVFQNIDIHNNQLLFIANDGLTSITPTITVPVGQYTINELLPVLEALINAELVALAPTASITLTFNTTINKIEFTIANFDAITLVGESATSTIADTLGLTANLGPVSSGTFQSIPDLSGESMVYLHSKDLFGSGTRLSNGVSVSSFASIPINVPFLGTITYLPDQMETNKIMFRSQTDLTTINIRLRAQDGRILELGSNHELIIVLKVFY